MKSTKKPRPRVNQPRANQPRVNQPRVNQPRANQPRANQSRSAARVAASPERMQRMLDAAGIRLNDGQLAQLWRFDQLLRKRNQDRDLTRLIEFESVVVKHYIDSMYVGRLIDLPSPLVDIGTGAGFPGIPLKIRYPHLQLVLAEQRPRRVAFLNEAIATLQLRQTETFKQRVVSRSFTTPMRGVITRAVEPIEKTLLRSSGCTRAGSRVIFLKGPGVDEELASAAISFGRDYRLIQDEPYSLPNSPHQRRLVVIERLRDPVVDEPGDQR
ncbi:MAG TPA: 16S rRNA (guanine(527)-N(7))-methyltransferase RsmG [Polyangiales bacterium]|jgi:16S rRNA (guanine527-N7)-methyltransferase|nr:16S rRNA (guanine(527)-N(7))-methyltransferase RsmG [Polyangiales bacterium]